LQHDRFNHVFVVTIVTDNVLRPVLVTSRTVLLLLFFFVVVSFGNTLTADLGRRKRTSTLPPLLPESIVYTLLVVGTM
jgi:hypothetical protein